MPDFSTWKGTGPYQLGRGKVDSSQFMNDPSAPFGAYGLNNAEYDPITGMPSLWKQWDKPGATSLPAYGMLPGEQTSEQSLQANKAYDIQASLDEQQYRAINGIPANQGLTGVAGFNPAGGGNQPASSPAGPSPQGYGQMVAGLGNIGALTLPGGGTGQGAYSPYTVKQGDTLGQIAQDMGGGYSKYPQIAKDNGIKNPDLIYPGQKINLPGQQVPTTAYAAPQTAQQVPGATQPYPAPEQGVYGPPTQQEQAYGDTAANNPGSAYKNGVYQGTATGGNPDIFPSGLSRREVMKAGPTIDEQKQLAESKNSYHTDVAQINSDAKIRSAEITGNARERTMQVMAAIKLAKGTSTGLSPEAVTMAADNYKKTGIMPAFGMSGKEDREAILNEAAKTNTGDLSTNVATFTADKKSLEVITKGMDSISAYADKAKNMMGLLSDLLGQIGRGSIPGINNITQIVDYQGGDPRIQGFRNNLMTTMTDYMKVVTAGKDIPTRELSMEAQKKVDNLLRIADNPETFKNSIDVMQKEMDFAKNTFVAKREDILKRMKGEDKPQGKPTDLSHFLTEAKKANPKATDAELTDYYNKKYGGGK